MMKKAVIAAIIIATVGICFLLGVVWATTRWDKKGEEVKTDSIIEGARSEVENIREILARRDEQTKTEIKYIERVVRSNVKALPDDDLADFINNELSLWRGGDSRSEGLGSSNGGILYEQGNSGGRGSRVTRAPIEDAYLRSSSSRP